MTRILATTFTLACFVPLAGCHHAFAQKTCQSRKWQLDHDACVVARTDRSYCLISNDPSLNYNRFSVEILDARGRQLSCGRVEMSRGKEEPGWDLSDFVARVDESRQIIWVVPQSKRDDEKIVLARTSDGKSDSTDVYRFGPDDGTPLAVVTDQ